MPPPRSCDRRRARARARWAGGGVPGAPARRGCRHMPRYRSSDPGLAGAGAGAGTRRWGAAAGSARRWEGGGELDGGGAGWALLRAGAGVRSGDGGGGGRAAADEAREAACADGGVGAGAGAGGGESEASVCATVLDTCGAPPLFQATGKKRKPQRFAVRHTHPVCPSKNAPDVSEREPWTKPSRRARARDSSPGPVRAQGDEKHLFADAALDAGLHLLRRGEGRDVSSQYG
jgi:hypothetical protein